MPSTPSPGQFDRTVKTDRHEIARQLIEALGPTLVAGLTGVADRKIPYRWAKPDGPQPRVNAHRRLIFAHRQFHEIAAAHGEDTARQWFIGSNPQLSEDTPVDAIREDRYVEVARAVRSFIDGDVSMEPPA